MSRIADKPDIPRRVPGVAPIGPLSGSGFAEPQWLVSREDRFVQVSELLYRVLEFADGSRDLEGIARELTASTAWDVSAQDVEQVIARKLAPLGLVESDSARANAPQSRAASPLLLNAGVRALGPHAIDRVARLLQHLYRPPLMAACLLAIVLSEVWMFVSAHPGAVMQQLAVEPFLLVIVTGVLVAAGVVHEFGHAAALRYSGGRARSMGVGLYLVIPVFYTDVSDGYRLDRRARLRTDLGGFYFHLLAASALVAAHALTGSAFLIIAAFLINLDIVRQLIPFVRLDGYWILADLTGIPDLFAHAGPRLRRRFTRGSEKRPVPALRPRVKRVFMAYVAVAVPAVAGLFGYLAWHAPTIVHEGIRSLGLRADLTADAIGAGRFDIVLVAVVESMLLTLPVAGVLALGFVVARFLSGLARRRFARRAPTAVERAARRAEARGRAGIAQPADEPLSFAAAIADHLELTRRHQDESAPTGERQLVAA